MPAVIYLRRARRALHTEWRYTFLSARRECTTRYAARLFVRELVKALAGIRHP